MPEKGIGTSIYYKRLWRILEQQADVATDADLVKALGKARDELRQHGQTLNEQS